MILVVSTGNASPYKRRCLDSVARQTVAHEHVYTDAAEQATPRGAMENQWRTIVASHLSHETIVALVDGDDWLPHKDCLSVVQDAHDAGGVIGGAQDLAHGFALPVSRMASATSSSASDTMTRATA